MDLEQLEEELLALRRSLEKPFAKAKNAKDLAEMKRLQDIARDIDELRIDMVLLSLAEITSQLARIREKIDGHKADIDKLVTGPVSAIKKAIQDMFSQTSEEDISTPTVATKTHDTIVKASKPPPKDPHIGLFLSDAHLIALWRRSVFPIDNERMTVFGLRGCRPVEFSGTAMGAEHEIALTPVDYQVMKCTIGHWKPGQGLALFPGSTVPFGPIVASKVSSNGLGVNQLGRGRYSRYIAGWHKRSEGKRGHWALLQDCAITIQRTGNDQDFDLSDRWEVGRIAGDNIHCAFHMGTDGNPGDSKFSSAGCQTIAGTVKKGKSGSESGPYRQFIAPFADKLGLQKETQYVLFDAEEAQMMIRTKCAGKTVILRYGSWGPLVEALQRALNRKGEQLVVDGDFGPSTFRAVTDFQSKSFGPESDDGIVGPATADKLNMSLPQFDFDDAISGGKGHVLPDGLSSQVVHPKGATSSAMVPPGSELAFGKITRNKHGQAFNDKVIEISLRLRCDANHLMAVMAFETGESFSPAKKNAAGSGATGLIQFMPNTAKDLKTTTKELAKMKAIDQLDYVERYFDMQLSGKPLPALSDLYMAVLWPVAVGKVDSSILFEKGSAKTGKAYSQNAGLDINKNGKITKAEATSKVQDKLVLGMKDSRFG